MPIISIIMPCYNQGKYICEAIESVINQTFLDWELIIVDDGSTDQTSSLVQQYISDKRIKYLTQSNSGPSAARNNGVKASNGKYIMPLDSDDKIASSYLELGVKYMELHNECTIFYGNSLYFGCKNGQFGIKYQGYKSLLVYNCIPCTCIYRRSDFERVGGYDVNQRGLEDWDFLIRLLFHNDIVYWCETVLFYYRQDNTRKSITDEVRERTRDIMTKIYLKNIDKYIEYWGTPHENLDRSVKLQLAIDSYNNAVNSTSYRLGHILLTPVRIVRKWFQLFN